VFVASKAKSSQLPKKSENALKSQYLLYDFMLPFACLAFVDGVKESACHIKKLLYEGNVRLN